MVTVINAGPDPSIVKRHICTNCGATLEYVPKDVKTRTETDYGGGSDTYRYIICPNCQDRQNVRY